MGGMTMGLYRHRPLPQLIAPCTLPMDLAGLPFREQMHLTSRPTSNSGRTESGLSDPVAGVQPKLTAPTPHRLVSTPRLAPIQRPPPEMRRAESCVGSPTSSWRHPHELKT